MRPFGRSLPMQLMRAREAVMQRFRPHLREHGLTEQQWRVIRALIDVDAVEILDLSARVCIHPASLSRILPRLESDGLITRRPNMRDQRRVIVAIAPRGRKLYETIAPRSEEIYAGIARDLGPERVREIYRVLDAMIDRLGPGGGSQAPGEE
jgi:homoprotocatechuate degradation regulator HpaR